MKYKDFRTFEGLRCVDAKIEAVHCGCETCSPGHAFGPYMRDHYLVHYVESGKGIFCVNNKVYNVGAGEIFFIVPHVITYYEADMREPWKYKWIGIRAEAAGEIFSLAGISQKNPVVRVGKNVSEAIDHMLDAAQNGKNNEIEFVACAYSFFSELLKNKKDEQHHLENSQIYVEKAVGFIRQYIYRKITVSELAAFVNVDRSYLSGIFKKYTGLPPQKYIMEMKMKTACEYLESTDYDIGKIANSVGYEDLFVFSHAFKSVMGMSPKKYRTAICGR